MATTQVRSTLDLINYYRAVHRLTKEEQERVDVLAESILGPDGPGEMFLNLATAFFNCGYEARLRCEFPSLDAEE